jgi:hypothetical protein
VCIRLRAGGVFPGKGNNPARIAAQPTGSRTMTRTKFSPAAAVAAGLLFTLVGCEAKKSETPLSPSVAGPIPGVEISTPRLIEPSMGAKLKDAQQPIRLMIENSNTSGVRPLAYTFEVASDTSFSSKVFGRGSVPPGGDGKTSVQIDRLEIGRTYFWRVRAEDGANSGPFLTAQFEVLPKAFISAPTPTSPVNNEVVASRQPTLHVRNVDKNSAVGGLVYEFQVSSNQAFTSLTGNGASYEGAGETTVKVGADLPNNATQYWRARAMDAETLGDWSVVQVFRTPNVAPAPAPTPTPTPSPGGGGSCASSNGPAIVACISAKYPDKLAAGVSSGQRVANMEFLRDRIIEAGKCGGLNLGWNLKRGGPERSVDFLAWHRGDGDMGIDIGFDYDNTSTRLQLQWSEAGLGATFQPYPGVSCSGV